MKAMIRYRPTLLQRVVPVLVGSILGLAVAYIIIVVGGSAPSTAEMKYGLIFLFATTLTNLILRPGYGIMLTPESATIHQGRLHVMDWRGVADISVEKEFGCRIMVIRGLDGQRVKLRVPSFLDREFDEKVKVIRAYWQGSKPRGLGAWMLVSLSLFTMGSCYYVIRGMLHPA